METMTPTSTNTTDTDPATGPTTDPTDDTDLDLTLDPTDLGQLETERDTIINHIQAIDAQLVARKSDLEQMRLACIAMGERGKQAYFEAEAEFNQWRSRAIGAKRHRVRELQDVKAQIKTVNSRATATQSTRRYQNLRRAIKEHQAAVLAGGYDPTPEDEELWSILDDHDRLNDTTHG